MTLPAGKRAQIVIKDDEWLKNEFTPTVSSQRWQPRSIAVNAVYADVGWGGNRNVVLLAGEGAVLVLPASPAVSISCTVLLLLAGVLTCLLASNICT